MIFLYIVALKKVFADNKDIQKLAEQFVLLNLVVSLLFIIIISPLVHYVKRVIHFSIHLILH